MRRAAALALAHRRRRDPLDGRMPRPRGPRARARRGGRAARRRSAAAGRRRRPPARRRGANGRAPRPPEPARGRQPREPAPAREPRPREPDGRAMAASRPGGPGPPRGDDPPSPGALARERRDAPAPAQPAARTRSRSPAPATAPPGGAPEPAARARARSTAVPRRPAREDVALVASLRARLLEGGGSGASAAPVREHVRSGREATFVCLVVDASGSMGARRRLARVKGALIALLRDAYARRDRVAVVAFRDSAARVARRARARRSPSPPPRCASCRPAGARRSPPGSTPPSGSSAARRCASPAGARSRSC